MIINRDVIVFPAAFIKTIGVISDTHNLLRSEALRELVGSDLVIHAGDIGEQRILEELELIAPVVVVRGNVDCGDWCRQIPITNIISVGEVKLYVIHNLKELNSDILEPDVKVIISGHSHNPRIEKREDILYLNPGSAGRRRFKLPISLAKIEINEGQVKPRLIELHVSSSDLTEFQI